MKTIQEKNSHLKEKYGKEEREDAAEKEGRKKYKANDRQDTDHGSDAGETDSHHPILPGI